MPESEGYEAAVEAAEEEGYLERAGATPQELEVIGSAITRSREDWLSNPGHERENSFLVDLTDLKPDRATQGIEAVHGLEEKTQNAITTRFIFGLDSAKVKDFKGDVVLMTPSFSLQQYRLALEGARNSVDASGKLTRVLDYRDEAGISADRQKLDLPRQFIIVMNREDYDRELKVISPPPSTTMRATVDFARLEDVQRFSRQEERRARLEEEVREPKEARPKTYVKLTGNQHGVVFGTTYESISNTFPVRLGGNNLPEFSVAILAESNKDGDDVIPLVPAEYADKITVDYQTTANGSAEPTSLKFNQDGRLSTKDIDRLNADLDPTSLRFRIQDEKNPYSVRVTKIDYGDNGKIRGFEIQGVPETKV